MYIYIYISYSNLDLQIYLTLIYIITVFEQQLTHVQSGDDGSKDSPMDLTGDGNVLV